MIQSVTGPSSGDPNKKYAKEGTIKIKQASVLHTQIEFTCYRSDILQYLLE
jgi:hypothetical protein